MPYPSTHLILCKIYVLFICYFASIDFLSLIAILWRLWKYTALMARSYDQLVIHEKQPISKYLVENVRSQREAEFSYRHIDTMFPDNFFLNP